MVAAFALSVLQLSFSALQLPSAPQAGAPALAASCPDAEWVSFAPKTPYDPAVADVAALVWLPNLLLPCPSLFLGVGMASLPGPLPADGHATGVALGHSVGIACCGLPLAATVIGLPLVLLETMWVAPVSVLNALDGDVRCARRREASMVPKPPTTTPTPPSALPPPDQASPRENPLPLPPTTTPAGGNPPLAMAF